MNAARRRTSKGGPKASLQRGVAAIEFALVFSVLFLAMYGIATFGAVFYIQQVVSRAAEDGARAIAFSFATSTFGDAERDKICLLYTSPSPRDQRGSRMPSSA